MNNADWIQFGILAIALITLMIQLGILISNKSQVERRSANKLKVFIFCQDNGHTREQIIQYLKDMGIKSYKINDEINKTIYEMLSDGTLRYRSNGTFKARRNNVNKRKDKEIS